MYVSDSLYNHRQYFLSSHAYNNIFEIGEYFIDQMVIEDLLNCELIISIDGFIC